ncbi:hypothetical protein JTB14_025499 [Gonioctena quinquepunctata]|nr:hypothetical protein JTB14_025499 [Gonioctena quinquepunctata]
MVQRFVELEDAIRSTIGSVDGYLPQMMPEECTISKDLWQVLKPSEDATRTVSKGKENYLTASLVIVLNRGFLDVCDKLSKEHYIQCCNKTRHCNSRIRSPKKARECRV